MHDTDTLATLLLKIDRMQATIDRLAAIVEAAHLQPMTRQQQLDRAVEVLAKQVESGSVNVAEISRATGIPPATLKTHKKFREYLRAARHTVEAAREIGEQTLRDRGAVYG